jgi:hypothetical protein
VRVYTEDVITFPNVEIKQLDLVPGWEHFQEVTKHIKPQSYHFNVSKFSHKVYAQLDAFESKHRYVVWLDADIVFVKPLKEAFLKSLLNDTMCAFLGRHECYTETGFLIFDTYHEDFPKFKQEYADYYNKRYIFQCKCWIDCCAFDAARKGLHWNNLTPDAYGMVSVFDKSPLAPLMEHDKGALKYRREDVPETEKVQAAS